MCMHVYVQNIIHVCLYDAVVIHNGSGAFSLHLLGEEARSPLEKTQALREISPGGRLTI